MTQENRVLEVLKKNEGEWVNGQYFLRSLLLSQYHRALWNLIHRKERYGYLGTIEASEFTDEWGFKSYRLVVPRMESVREIADPLKLTMPLL